MAQVKIRDVKNLIQIGLAQGIELSSLLDQCNFGFNPMEDAGRHTEVSAEQYALLSKHIAFLLQDECFGFYRDYAVPCGTFQMMCYAILPCTTLQAAIMRMHEFANMCACIRGEPAATVEPLSVDSNGRLAHYSDPQLTVNNISDVFQSQHAIAGTLSSWHRFCSWLIGVPIELRQVSFEGRQQVNPATIQRYFNCRPVFEQPSNALTFERRFLDMPLRQNETSLAAFLKTTHVLLLPQQQQQSTELAIEERVRAAIGYNFTIGTPSFDDIANALSLPPRKLRRQLEHTGKTFRQILQEQRKEVVLSLLARPELALNAIAAIMGFDEPSTFHRAFKKWFGMPPGQYRQVHWGGQHPMDSVQSVSR